MCHATVQLVGGPCVSLQRGADHGVHLHAFSCQSGRSSTLPTILLLFAAHKPGWALELPQTTLDGTRSHAWWRGPPATQCLLSLVGLSDSRTARYTAPHCFRRPLRRPRGPVPPAILPLEQSRRSSALVRVFGPRIWGAFMYTCGVMGRTQAPLARSLSATAFASRVWIPLQNRLGLRRQLTKLCASHSPPPARGVSRNSRRRA
jgi:hypothetical protein